jgi:8-oxo-dGTP pyrophosphatase MutT (NUDIX family)
MEVPPNAQEAAVLVLLFKQTQHWRLIFIERKYLPEDKHAGQISFPGGKKESPGEPYEECALRETAEEIGIGRTEVFTLGRLSPVYIPVSNNYVIPVVGSHVDVPKFKMNPLEVQHVITVPLSTITNKNTIKRKDMVVRSNIRLKNVPYFNIEPYTIWGATAMILSEFIHIIKEFKQNV